MTPESEFARAELLLGAQARRETEAAAKAWDTVFSTLAERKAPFQRNVKFAQTIKETARDYGCDLNTLISRHPEEWRSICSSFFREHPGELGEALEPSDCEAIALAYSMGDHAHIGTIVAKAMMRYIAPRAAQLYESELEQWNIKRAEGRDDEWSGPRECDP
jgi:hypothetical protein